MTKIISRIEEIVLEINTKLDTLQETSVGVGSLLIEAKEEMTGNGKKYADFIQWCGMHFNIGKAQASKLMRVATVFKEDDRFKGVAMRVLYALAVNATPEQMDRAAEFAASGTLDTAVVNQLLNPTPVKAEETQAKTETVEEKEDKQAEIDKALANIPSVAEQMEANNKLQDADTGVLDGAEVEGFTREIKELREALNAANELIKSLQSEKVQHNTASKAPYLPQFDNACSYAVLGLGNIEAKQVTKVKKAFRELIKCGYGKGHDAFEKLTAAKDQLLANIEADKANK